MLLFLLGMLVSVLNVGYHHANLRFFNCVMEKLGRLDSVSS